MNKKYRINLYCFFFFIILFISCIKDKDDNKDTTPVIPPVTGETVIATTSGTIGSAGGTVKLSDGAAVEIAAGVLTSETKIIINKIGNEVNFGADNRYCYEISGLAAGIKAKLVFPCPKDKSLLHTGVYNYSVSKDEGFVPAYSYDAVAGTITVDNYTLIKKNVAEPDYKRWIVEWNDVIGLGNEAKVIAMPFYEQIAGTCWATDATMLAKGYTPYIGKEINPVTIANYMNYLNLTSDEGINLSIIKKLVTPFQFLTGGTNASYARFVVMNNLLKAIISNLKEDKPVILLMPNRGHAVLVIGYRSYVNTDGYDEWELVIHDTKNVNPPTISEGCMFTTRKWSWFKENISIAGIVGIFYAEKAVSPDRSLQSVNLPSAEQPLSFIKFEYYKNNNKGYIYLKYDKDADNGYSWVNAINQKTDTIPRSTKVINLKLQLFNADPDNSKDVLMQLMFYNRDKDVKTYEREFPVNLPVGKNPVYFTCDIDTSEWHKPYGETNKTNYYIKIRMIDKSSREFIDGYTLFFTIKDNIPPKYISTFDIPKTNISIDDGRFKADMTMNISGGNFKVNVNELKSGSLRYIEMAVPKPGATPVNYKFHVDLANLVIDRTNWNPNMIDPFFIVKAVSTINSQTLEYSGAGPWDFIVPVNNTTGLYNFTVEVWADGTDASGSGAWGCDCASNILSVKIKTE